MLSSACALAGWRRNEIINLQETPLFQDQLLIHFRRSFQSADSAILIPYYAHSYQYRSYHSISVDGHTFIYLGFSGGQFIKFAPSLDQTHG